MKTVTASCKKLRMMRISNCHRKIISVLPLLTIGFVALTQPPETQDQKAAILSIAYFVESANNSLNSINSLLKKDNYRNKITTLNNPTNNELGFSLKDEILTALQPILAKAKKTDKKKFGQVIDNFLSNPEENGIGSVKRYMPALGLFSTVLSLVGNLVITERNITSEDLQKFVAKIQQYFSQYEELNHINYHFGAEVEKLLERSAELKVDLKDFLVDCIYTMNDKYDKNEIKELPVELMLQRFYDPQKLHFTIDTSGRSQNQKLFPSDAPTSVKLLTSGIKRLQKEFEALYNENYKQLKDLLNSLEKTIPGLDKERLTKTNTEIDKLFNESRHADLINLNIIQVDERMNTVCRTIR